MGKSPVLSKQTGNDKSFNFARLQSRVNLARVRGVRKPPRVYHPMITASDAEIRQWNANVKTRQVLRSVIKPWRYPHREWRTML